MEITGVEWTSLTEDFGYYTVDVDGLPEFEPAPFKNPTLVNPFWAWKVQDEIETFIGDVVEDLMPPTENIGVHKKRAEQE